jgi:hypothetical protein
MIKKNNNNNDDNLRKISFLKSRKKMLINFQPIKYEMIKLNKKID